MISQGSAVCDVPEHCNKYVREGSGLCAGSKLGCEMVRLFSC